MKKTKHWRENYFHFPISVHAELPISGQPAPLHSLNGNVVKGYDGERGTSNL